MKLSAIIKSLEQKQIEKDIAEKNINEYGEILKQEKGNLQNLEKLKALIIELGNKTQKEILDYIEETVTLALQSVYGESFSFKIQVETKRDQQEVSFFVEEEGELFEPKDDTTSGGVIDVCSFALRMILWSLENPQVSPVLILDEPFKNVSKGNYIFAVSQMVKEIAKLLNLQLIYVTHEESLKENADNVIQL